jgi:alpha 1,3-glucosidase
MDISFPRSSHVFGLPEHASSLELKATLGEGAHYSDPYRLYNLDVFEYELDETMALYGYVPLVVSQSVATGTCGVFWFNPTETFVDVMSDGSDNGKTTHWISESGIIDTFLLPGPTPADMYRQYAILTGTAPVPPMFSLGYHQCRWNYKDERDVYQVHSKFEELDYPYDVLWLDIEHTDGKRYFTWDENLFPHPVEMQQKLASQGRRMVTIIDPHIKRDDGYPIHKEATSKGLYIKDKDGKKDYDGWCWPGSSSYLDFTNSKVRSWWADQFAYNKYQGSTSTLFTWNDMNEPSVFNGPEVTMQKDLRNLDGVEQREWHNLYGILFQRATGEGQIRRNHPDEDVRPFVLTRSFFAGSQRYGAIWTGECSIFGTVSRWTPLPIYARHECRSQRSHLIPGFFGAVAIMMSGRPLRAHITLFLAIHRRQCCGMEPS